MQYEKDSADYNDRVVPVRSIYGFAGAGPIDVSVVAESVHVGLGDAGAYLDPRTARFLIRAINDALDMIQ